MASLYHKQQENMSDTGNAQQQRTQQHGNRIPVSVRQEMIRLRDSGMSVRQIAKAIGVCHSSVVLWCKHYKKRGHVGNVHIGGYKMDILKRKRDKRTAHLDVEHLKALYAELKSYPKVVEHLMQQEGLRVTQTTLYHYLNKK